MSNKTQISIISKIQYQVTMAQMNTHKILGINTYSLFTTRYNLEESIRYEIEFDWCEIYL